MRGGINFRVGNPVNRVARKADDSGVKRFHAVFQAQEKFPFEFSVRTYAITGGLAALYGLAGSLVWFGAPGGRFFSRVCGLLYLARPKLGSLLWQIMDSAEFQSHFTGRPPEPPPL